MKNIISMTAVLLILSSCAFKQRILNASAVSMTKYSLKKNQTLEEVGEVSGEFCPDSFNDTGNVGLLDEAIKKAQKSNKADFLTHVTFYSQGRCVLVEGTAMRITKKK